MPGKQLFLVLGLLLSSCRDSIPPRIEICIGDGTGGANCTEADGSHITRLPSGLKGYWMTNEPDQADFAGWCYDAEPSQIKPEMERIRRDLE